MTHAFQRHGIDHLSASSLNLWRNAPGIWALNYIAKIKNDGNAAMWRGSAVESGLTVLLRTGDIGKACTAALQSFDLNAQGELSDEITAERDLIEPMVRQCQHWTPPSVLNATQIRIEHWLDNIPIPVIGYLDFAFEGIDIDGKTTKACPSVPRAEHVRQVSLYRVARNRAGGILYITGKRHAYFDVDDESVDRSLSDLAADALSLRNFLARCDSKDDALRSLPIDYENFRAPKTRVPLANLLDAG